VILFLKWHNFAQLNSTTNNISMKKSVLFSTGMLVLTLLGGRAHAQNPVLYSTYNDWTNFNGSGAAWSSPNYTPLAVTTFDYDGVTVDGVGNATPGATSPGGSLQMSPIVSGWQPICSIGDQSLPILQALDGPLATTGSLVAQHGTLFVEYTQPDNGGGGTYFSLALYLNYNGGWQQWWPSSTIDLGPVTTPSGTEEMYEAVIPYDISACTLTYFNFGLFQNTDFTGVNPWYVDNISAAYIPPIPFTNAVCQLFNTSDDFGLMTAQSGVTLTVDTTWSETNDIVIDGLGNTVSPGATSTNASLSVDWTATDTSWGPIVALPNEGGNLGFLQAIDPGCDPVSTLSVPAYGFFYIDYTYPDNVNGPTNGGYFQLGISWSYAGNGWNQWSPDFWSTSTDLGYKDENGDELNRATCQYQISGGAYLNWGFYPYIYVNSNFQPSNSFHIAAMSVSSSGSPVFTNIYLNGDPSLVIQGTNGMAGCSYSLFSTTNLAVPYTNWTLVGSPGNAFTAPSFAITNPVPAVPTYYGLTVSQ
jgi:hypothetical protein